MKRTHQIRLIRIAALCIAFLLLAGCAEIRDNRVSVMLLDCPGVRVTSRNPMLVNAGDNAVFNVEVDDGYVVLPSSEFTYDSDAKTVTIPRVIYPASVPMETLESDGTPCEISYADPLQKGKIITSLPEGTYPAGMALTLNCEPVEGYTFAGWTKNAPLTHGGKLIAYRADLTFVIEESMRIFANFTADSPLKGKVSKRTILYQGNGGTYVSTGKSFATVDVDVSYWDCPNCLPAKDYFAREGYQLIEYNTKADGTGDAYSLGSKVILPKDEAEVLTLFCIWEKETPVSAFTYTVNGSNVKITKCTSKDKTITVPATIDGKKVTTIGTQAFDSLPVETMIFPNTILTVEKSAINNCASFTTFYLHDNVSSITDATISGKNNFHNFRLNNAATPKYCNSTEGCFPKKWERLVMSEKPCIIVMSGSSSLNGLNSPMMEEAFDNKYTVVNYGTNAGTCGCLYMEFVSHFVEKGDILIDAPEMGGDQAGNMNVTWKMFRANERMNNIWRYVDIGRYAKLFSSLQEHNSTRASMG
ncbi:MAG: leucine-rich repeat protein, partial [Clostridia bacterium]|nr:leucine-rich repeat protein [Clostridia bacterium]